MTTFMEFLKEIIITFKPFAIAYAIFEVIIMILIIIFFITMMIKMFKEW